MLQQPVSVINTAGATTADDRVVSYDQSSTTPSLQYSAGFTYDARGNRTNREFQVSRVKGAEQGQARA